MSFTIQAYCEKCDEEFDKVEVGIGATHPTSYCPSCKFISHPKRKVWRRGWFCRHCKTRQYPENSIDLYRGSLHETRCQCPNSCGSTQSLKQIMHSLHAIPTTFIGKLIEKTMTRLVQYF